MALEGDELLVPVCLQLVKPPTYRHDRLPTKAEDSHASIRCGPFVGDHAGLEKDPQVLAHGRATRTQCVSKLSRSSRRFAQQFDRLQPGRIGERTQ
jgi:hypothetical protein